MTRDEFLEKVEELKRGVDKLIDEKADKLLNSGAIDLESYDNNFCLPKRFMAVMGKEINFQYRPLFENEDVENDMENIYYNI